MANVCWFTIRALGHGKALASAMILLQEWADDGIPCWDLGLELRDGHPAWAILYGGPTWCGSNAIRVRGECDWSPPDGLVEYLSLRSPGLTAEMSYHVPDFGGGRFRYCNGIIREIDRFDDGADDDLWDLSDQHSSLCTYYVRNGQVLDTPVVGPLYLSDDGQLRKGRP